VHNTTDIKDKIETKETEKLVNRVKLNITILTVVHLTLKINFELYINIYRVVACHIVLAHMCASSSIDTFDEICGFERMNI
jgi:predicted metalloenzyme YecM